MYNKKFSFQKKEKSIFDTVQTYLKTLLKIKCGTRGCGTLTVEMLKPLTEEQRTEDSDVLLDIGKVVEKKKKEKGQSTVPQIKTNNFRHILTLNRRN